MKITAFYTFLILLSVSNIACGQNKDSETGNSDKTSGPPVGGYCEGCEAVYESPIPLESLTNIDTLPGFYEDAAKLTMSGKVFQKDGITPAKDVVLYVYHTDDKGYYSQKGGETGWAQRHGYLRGWMKTNEAGEYIFYTMRPAPYPEATEPAHIHIIVKEPGINEYYIDDYVFTDDKFVDDDYKKRLNDLGGSGIIELRKDANGNFSGTRDIILGKNISNYP